MPHSSISFTNEHGSDSRTYKVSFKKILKDLAEIYKPKYDLINGGKELVDYFHKIKFTRESFEGSDTNRLKKLKELVKNKKINDKLKWY